MRVDLYDDDRDLLLRLFMLADDSQAQIAAYISRGEVLVAREGEMVIGHLQLLETNDTGVFELKSGLSHSPQFPGATRPPQVFTRS